NVRELKNEMHRAYILAEEVVDAELLKSMPTVQPAGASSGSGLDVQPGTPLADVEKQVILSTLDKFGDDKKRTAEALGVSVKTLYNKLKQYRAEAGDESD
ncbi:MAG: sigma-54-dependent Fis family transcriptional regulator, partial [Gammaproteobacteria bacterium]|nr:sigma-54-dependent Fis family transcriptional regulator [Gammaproteobacteria bacterium]